MSSSSARVVALREGIAKARHVASRGRSALASSLLLNVLTVAARPLAVALGVGEPHDMEGYACLKATCALARRRLAGVVGRVAELDDVIAMLDEASKERDRGNHRYSLRALVRATARLAPFLFSEAMLKYLQLETKMYLSSGKAVPGLVPPRGLPTRNRVDVFRTLQILAWVACGWHVLAVLAGQGLSTTITLGVIAVAWFVVAQVLGFLRRARPGARLAAAWRARVPLLGKMACTGLSLLGATCLPAFTFDIIHEGGTLHYSRTLVGMAFAPSSSEAWVMLFFTTWTSLVTACIILVLVLGQLRGNAPTSSWCFKTSGVMSILSWLVSMALMIAVAWWVLANQILLPFLPGDGVFVVRATPALVLPAIAVIASSG